MLGSQVVGRCLRRIHPWAPRRDWTGEHQLRWLGRLGIKLKDLGDSEKNRFESSYRNVPSDISSDGWGIQFWIILTHTRGEVPKSWGSIPQDGWMVESGKSSYKLTTWGYHHSRTPSYQLTLIYIYKCIYIYDLWWYVYPWISGWYVDNIWRYGLMIHSAKLL